MLRVDFGQSLLDHRGVLILVQPVGYIGDKPFRAIYDEISGYRRAQVPNTTRILHLRYSKRVTPQFIEWGNFHFHRRVLGLICVGKCSEINEVAKLEKPVNEIKNPFSAILLNTRCFVFGCKSTKHAKVRKDFALISGEDHSRDLQSNLAEFVASLFNVLESKRLSKLSEKVDKIVLIHAPVEHETFGGENDNRTTKRKTIGRSKKYTGDLCMLAGLPQEALSQYLIAGEHLRAANDLLWLAGTLEGQCAASLAFITNEAEEGIKSLILPTECAANSVNVTSNGLGSEVDESKFRNPLPLNEEDMVERLQEALKHYSRVKGAAVIETEANLKFTRLLILCQRRIEASIALQNSLSVNISLTEQEKIQRYNTAALLYDELGFRRKAGFFSRIAAVQCVSSQLPKPLWLLSYNFLMSALEAYRIHLDQKNIPKGSVIYLECDRSEVRIWEGTKDFDIAWRLVGVPTCLPNSIFSLKSPCSPWIALATASKYGSSHQNGWPALQIRLLNEIICTSRYLGDPSLSVRHVTFLLHTMHDHLRDDEKRELSVSLESSLNQNPGSPREKENNKTDVLDMASLSLTKMPVVRSFKVQPLAPHMRPVTKKSLSNPQDGSSSPFIFSSLKRNAKGTKQATFMTWVCGDIGQVSLEVFNPMPFELKVSNMVLCVEGVEFEPYPTCLSLPAKAGPHAVILLGIPKSVGSLRITGYTVTVFGVESTCRLTEKNMESKADFPVVVNVVSSLPVLQVSTSLPKVRTQPLDPDTPLSAPVVTAVTLYAGQSMKGTIKLDNTSKLPVDSLTITISGKDGEGANELFSFDDKEITSKLPLLPGNSTDITVTITGVHHFSQGVVSGENLSYDPEATWGLTGSIQFRYSTKVSGSNLCRNATMAIDVTVVPSLLCANYQILELPSDRHHCLLMFDAVNKTSNDMELSSSLQNGNMKSSEDEPFTKEVIYIQGNDKNSVTLKLPRFAPTLSMDSAKADHTDSKLQRRMKCKRFVCDRVKLHWNLPVCRASGNGNVDNLTLDAAMMQALLSDPIKFDVSINGEAHDNITSKEMTISLCTVVDLAVTVSNETDESRGPLLLSIDPYQDQAFGCPVTELDGKVTWFGTLKSKISQLSPRNSLCHQCSLVFLYVGQYMVSISCSDIAAEQWQSNDTSSSLSERNRDSETCRTDLNDGQTTTMKKSWTFSPPIKIKVVE